MAARLSPPSPSLPSNTLSLFPPMSYDARSRYLSAYFARLASRFSHHSSIHSACQVASNGFASNALAPAQGVIMANTFRLFVRPVLPLPLP